jgi:nucleotide-binding universal stress UspA family protein
MNLVVGHDGHPASVAALGVAADLAARLGAHLHVVHCVTVEDFGVDPDTEQFENEGDRTIARERNTIEGAMVDAAVTWTYHEERGNPSARLAAVAEAVDAVFIVVGATHRGMVPALTGGSVSRRLLHLQHRPVLVVPEPGAAAQT